MREKFTSLKPKELKSQAQELKTAGTTPPLLVSACLSSETGLLGPLLNGTQPAFGRFSLSLGTTGFIGSYVPQLLPQAQG